MFEFWLVYSGERFRASWASCYVMGKALSGDLSCPCDRSCLNFSVYCMVSNLKFYTVLKIEGVIEIF